MIETLEKLALEIEINLSGDEEIEIDNSDGNICICRYSPSRGSAELEKVFCASNEINRKAVIKLCNKHKWSYVL